MAREAHNAPDPCQPVRLPLPSVTVKEARILLLVSTALQRQLCLCLPYIIP